MHSTRASYSLLSRLNKTQAAIKRKLMSSKSHYSIPTSDYTPPVIIRRNMELNTFPSKDLSGSTFNVIPVPCLSDNYAYILHDISSNRVALVDPVEPNLVINALDQLNLDHKKVKMVLTTHRHSDHAGGNKEIAKIFPGIEIYGGKLDQCEAATVDLSGNETISLGSTTIKTISTPCHTRGHICYLATGMYKQQGEPDALFSGDTLFIGGCGRLFEGTAAMMFHNISGTLSALDDNTKIYSGHEYTLANLKFGLEITTQQLKNATTNHDKEILQKALTAIQNKIQSIQYGVKGFNDEVNKIIGDIESADTLSKFDLGTKYGFGRFSTQGSTIQEERLINVFMRTHDANEFATIRAAKDVWKGPSKIDT